MKTEQLRVHNILLDTIRLLCKNSLPFNQSLRIEGVIGITTDSSDVFLVHVNETLGTDNSSSIVKQETSHEGSFGMVTHVRQSHAVAAPPFSQREYIKIEEDVPPAEVADFSCVRAVAKPFKRSAVGFDIPILQNMKATGTTYDSEGSTAISSTVVMLGSNDGLQNGGIYYEEDGQDEYGDQQDYKTGEERDMWSTAYDTQHHNTNHQNSFATPPKVRRCSIKLTKTKQARHGCIRGRARMARGKVGRFINIIEQSELSDGGESNQFVITKSTQVCGYPDCMKEFCHRKDLLRHQTKHHGRERVPRKTHLKDSYSSALNEECDLARHGGIRGRGRARVGRRKVNGSRSTAFKEECDLDYPTGESRISDGGDSTQFVITKSTQVCGYPDCMKEFCHRKDLLRHQTKHHGREPAFRKTSFKGSRSSGLNEDFVTGMMQADYDNVRLNDDSCGYEQYE